MRSWLHGRFHNGPGRTSSLIADHTDSINETGTVTGRRDMSKADPSLSWAWLRKHNGISDVSLVAMWKCEVSYFVVGDWSQTHAVLIPRILCWVCVWKACIVLLSQSLQLHWHQTPVQFSTAVAVSPILQIHLGNEGMSCSCTFRHFLCYRRLHYTPLQSYEAQNLASRKWRGVTLILTPKVGTGQLVAFVSAIVYIYCLYALSLVIYCLCPVPFRQLHCVRSIYHVLSHIEGSVTPWTSSDHWTCLCTFCCVVNLQSV